MKFCLFILVTIVDLRDKDIYEEGHYMVFDMHLKGDKRNQVAVNSHISPNSD